MRIRLFNTLFFRNKRLHKLVQTDGTPVYLNLGSGPRGLSENNWVNIDGFMDKNVQYVCDFNRKLPFNNDSFDAIFCEHVIEHFDFEHGKNLLNECRRILKPGGVIRIIVPDGETIIKGYLNKPETIIKYKTPTSKTAMGAVNIWFYQRYEHQCIYDFDYLKYLLKSINFSRIEKSGFKFSALSPEAILLDDEKYNWESLYVDALK